jgi:hypothetical protein
VRGIVVQFSIEFCYGSVHYLLPGKGEEWLQILCFFLCNNMLWLQVAL